MAHAQKPGFVFRRNGRVHLNRQGASVQSTTGSRGVRISSSNAGYSMFRGCAKSTDTHSIRQFPHHFPSRASPYAITFQLDSNTHFAHDINKQTTVSLVPFLSISILQCLKQNWSKSSHYDDTRVSEAAAGAQVRALSSHLMFNP
jgi:hypothetical protein